MTSAQNPGLEIPAAVAAASVATWSDEVDVLVIGAGMAGTAAAIDAADAGARVLLLDRGGRMSCTSAMAGGHFYLGGGTPVQQAAGFDDSPAEMAKYLTAVSPDCDPDKIRAYADGSVEHFGWQATAFRAEQERIALGEAGVVKRPRALGGEGEQPRMTKAFQTAGEVCVALQGGILMVIEARPAQALVVHLEAQRFDQMQVAATVGAQPDNVAGIRRNFWLEKDDVKHARLRR